MEGTTTGNCGNKCAVRCSAGTNDNKPAVSTAGGAAAVPALKRRAIIGKSLLGLGTRHAAHILLDKVLRRAHDKIMA